MQRDATEPILLDEDLVDSRPLIDDPEPERKPFGERFAEWRKHYLPLPDEVIEEFLGEDEYVVHTDHPSFRAFLIQNIILLAVVIVVGPIFVFLAQGGITWTTLLLFLGLDVVLLYMAIKRLQDRYVSYVITNLRLIRLQGVFGRRLNSIPWTRMTGLGYFQTPVGRILGYATVFIESANEESGLRRFSNINDPATFHQRILDMVSSKTGQSAGGKPPPPTKGVRKSLLQRRKERRELGGPNKAAAPWPTSDDPDGDASDKPGPTDTARAYEASVPDEEKKPSGSKQALRPQPAGRRGGPGVDGPGRRGQAPPSARRRGPAPPGPTDPYGDPVAPGPRGSGAPPGRRPGAPGSAGRPSVADTTPRGQQLPRSGERSPGEGRPSLIPDYGRNRPGATPTADPTADEGSAPVETGADETGAGETSVDEAGSTGFPQPRRESPPLSPPRGTARIRPGEPRTSADGTGTGPSRGPAPTPPPPRPPQRGLTGRRPTPPAGTPAVRPGEPRDPFPPTDAAAETTDLGDETIDLRSAPGPTPDREPRSEAEPLARTDTTADRLTDPGAWPDPTTNPDQAATADAAIDSPPDLGPGPIPTDEPATGQPGAERDTTADPGRRPRAGGSDPEPGTRPRPETDATASASAERDTTAGRRPGAGGPGPATGSTADTGPETQSGPADSAGGRPSTGRGPSGRSTTEDGAHHRPDADAGTGPRRGTGDRADAEGGAAEASTGPDSGLRSRDRGTESDAEPETEIDSDTGSSLRTDDDPSAEADDARVADVPEFAPPPPRTPPSSRLMTPPGGTSAVRPGEPRTPPSAGDVAGTEAARPPKTETVIPPSLRRQTPPGGTSAVHPGEQPPPRRPGPETGRPAGSSEDAGETGADTGEPRRQPWLFGRPRPEAGEQAGRRRRRFSWFRREPLVDEDQGADGDAHDALETLRPLGSARRRAQSFRRPRFRSFGRGRRSLFPPNRALPPAATDDDPDTPDDRPS